MNWAWWLTPVIPPWDVEAGRSAISYVTTVRSAWDTYDSYLVSPQKRKIPDEKHACIDTCVHTEKHICDIFICIYIYDIIKNDWPMSSYLVT